MAGLKPVHPDRILPERAPPGASFIWGWEMSTRFLARPGLVLLAALLGLCPPLLAQRLGSVTGTVTTGQQRTAIVGARVSLVGTPFLVTTNSRGEFSFNGLTPGKYVIQASAIGFSTLSSEIEVKALELLEIDFEVDGEVVRLPDVEVAETPNLPAEFLRRSREGGGRYFHRAEIEQRNPRTVGDLLRTVAGMRVDCRGPVCRAVFARSSRNCQPSYFMDGMPVDAAVVWMQPPRDLDGVEVYSGPATVPPELNRYGGCGAIVLWTRTPPRRVKKEKPPAPKDPPGF
jgi:hypothetical protein